MEKFDSLTGAWSLMIMTDYVGILASFTGGIFSVKRYQVLVE